jgi:predicted aminopeptidase
MRREQPVQKVIADQNTDAALRQRLIFVRGVLDFAHTRLHLPDNGSYQSYADLGRPYVTWNVVATPALSLKPKQWCYLIAGCLSYRGYFTRKEAEAYAEKLRHRGFDVYVGGVRAYSTLGWFRDPVLNTMLGEEDWEIARLLFHELAHQKLYIENEVDVNEAFAEAVARIGLSRWLQSRPPAVRRRARAELRHEDALMALLRDYSGRLNRLYRSSLPDGEKRAKKAQLFRRLQDDYRQLKQRWGGDDRYDAWMEDNLNNAKLAAVSTYHDLIPDLMAVYDATGRDLKRFYNYMEGLKNCGHAALLQRIETYSPGHGCRGPGQAGKIAAERFTAPLKP